MKEVLFVKEKSMPTAYISPLILSISLLSFLVGRPEPLSRYSTLYAWINSNLSYSSIGVKSI